MGSTIKIGIIGDYDEYKISHPATNEAIKHAGDYLQINIKYLKEVVSISNMPLHK